MELLDKLFSVDGDVFRNIVSLKESTDLFDELTEGDPTLAQVAIEAEGYVKNTIPPGVIDRGFHYTTAVEYPFKTDPFMLSRYGDGTYGVWYGALEAQTTIFETAYHALFGFLGDIGNLDETVVQERAVYLVHCKALLVDLRGKQTRFPDLISNDYSACRQIGHRLHFEGHPGLVAPSARCKGACLAIFEPKVLSNPRVSYYLTYILNPAERFCRVVRGADPLLDIKF